jgi:hypothetical protein
MPRTEVHVYLQFRVSYVIVFGKRLYAHGRFTALGLRLMTIEKYRNSPKGLLDLTARSSEHFIKWFSNVSAGTCGG